VFSKAWDSGAENLDYVRNIVRRWRRL
jgi:hypothetical protein